MACCNSGPNAAYWSLFGPGNDGKRKLSVRPMFSRWKKFGKSRELLEKDDLLDGRESMSVVESGRSVSRGTYYAASSRDGAYSSMSQRPAASSMSKKISQPVLRAIKSIRHFELLHSISDVDLRENSALANSYNHNQDYNQEVYPTAVEIEYDSVNQGHRFPVTQPIHQHPAHAAHTVTTPQPPLIRPRQQTSRLLALPQEIRDEIYAYVFYSTRLTLGRRVTCAPPATSYSCPGSSSSMRTLSPEPGRHSHSHSHDSQDSQDSQTSSIMTSQHGQTSGGRIITQIKPARHSMALFLVCRQITRELVSDNAWIGQVLFNFEDAATMLDILGGVFSSPAQRSLIREVRVREGGLFVHQRLSQATPVENNSSSSSTSSATASTPQQFRQRFLLLGGLMRLLPGLCLDRLTILPALPCRVHKSTGCHNQPSVDMYNMSVTSNPPPPVSLAAPHEILAELLHAGSGWKELCYVHHDTAMLAADKHRPSSLEAMMINMGFWDADGETYEDVFAAAERAEREEQEVREEEEAARLLFLDEDEELQEGESSLFASPTRQHSHRRHRLGSLFASYAARKEYRLPRWRHLLTERDGLIPANSDTTKTASPTGPRWNVSIDAVIDEGFYEGDTPRSTVSVYGVRGGQAMWPMETLEDVHDSRIRGEDFMVIVRRGDGDEGEGTSQKKKDSSKAIWVETVGNPYPFKEGDPRALGYGTRWETLRPVLFPWDHLTATRSRRDRYRHRDEYVVRSQRRRI
ncbi:hypothetical protein SEUCBS140593_009766 [Sporothrix eucalyptigena]|uniref:F-box domain-containing protein n=1 Tax=Sporothrix eucalyptigena TaxID=1812306 RepID=A0ABP0D0T0_9PEZI